MMLQTQGQQGRDSRLVEQEVKIEALGHLIDEDFDTRNSCHAVCLLLTQLYADSDNRIDQKVADLATKALQLTVEMDTARQ